MFKNYFKIALRNIIRHKGFSFINITGLAIGIACSILILLWIQDELSFDNFHQDADRIFITCLGLFGLAAFTAEQKTKEIGVRKVLGASVPSIVSILLKQFTRWVILADIIAWPIGYFIMKSWLQKFA